MPRQISYPDHGTYRRYLRGCRGQECKGACTKAWAAYTKDYRKRRTELANGERLGYLLGDGERSMTVPRHAASSPE